MSIEDFHLHNEKVTSLRKADVAFFVSGIGIQAGRKWSISVRKIGNLYILILMQIFLLKIFAFIYKIIKELQYYSPFFKRFFRFWKGLLPLTYKNIPFFPGDLQKHSLRNIFIQKIQFIKRNGGQFSDEKNIVARACNCFVFGNDSVWLRRRRSTCHLQHQQYCIR